MYSIVQDMKRERRWFVVDVEAKPKIIGQVESEEEAWEVVATQVRPADYVVAKFISAQSKWVRAWVVGRTPDGTLEFSCEKAAYDPEKETCCGPIFTVSPDDIREGGE